MYKEHCNTTMALVACQHNCLGWLDDDVDFVRVLSSDFSKAFDALSKNSLFEKLRYTNLNPFSKIQLVVELLLGCSL